MDANHFVGGYSFYIYTIAYLRFDCKRLFYLPNVYHDPFIVHFKVFTFIRLLISYLYDSLLLQKLIAYELRGSKSGKEIYYKKIVYLKKTLETMLQYD